MDAEARDGSPAGAPTLGDPPIELSFRPQGRRLGLPVEIFTGAELRDRIPAHHRRRPQRADFNLLLVHDADRTTHAVDFVRHSLTKGSAVRIRPGQTYQFLDPQALPSHVVIWRVEHQVERPGQWFPGGPSPTAFQLEPAAMKRVRTWLDELRTQQSTFDRSPRHVELMRTILRGLLLLVEESDGETDATPALPDTYVELRGLLEEQLYSRPSVQDLSRQLGCSARTLDRVCQRVTGHTAKHVVEERIGLELRRLLADESVAIGKVRRSFGFDESSNFAKYVRRLLGHPPAEFRARNGR